MKVRFISTQRSHVNPDTGNPENLASGQKIHGNKVSNRQHSLLIHGAGLEVQIGHQTLILLQNLHWQYR